MLNKLLFFASVLLWFFVIFQLSGMPTESSNSKSKEFLTNFTISVSVVANKLGIIKEMPTNAEISKFVNKINYPMRKVAHATVYFVLATILMFGFRKTFKLSFPKCCIIVLIICFAYSITDEYHQTFISGRTGQFSDCLIDTIGAGFSVLIYSVCKKIFGKEKEKLHTN